MDRDEETPLISTVDDEDIVLPKVFKAKNLFFEPLFEKEKFKNLDEFEIINNLDYKEDIETINNIIKKISSDVLFHWKNIPIKFPSSIIDIDSETCNQKMNKLFIIPTFNELEEISIDASGKRKNLSKEQLNSIKKRGEFEVSSAHFEGKSHRWKLASWLQKGYEISNETFFKTLSISLELLIVVAKNRFTSNNFSILSGLRSWKKGILRLFDIIFGLPQTNIRHYNNLLEEEMTKFLVLELTVDVSEKEKYDQFISKARFALNSNSNEDQLNKETVQIPYFYRTPDNKPIDLRLLSSHLREKITPILAELIELNENQKEVLTNLRRESINTLRNDESLSKTDLIHKVNEILKNEYLKQLYAKLENNKKLENVSPGIGKLLIDHVKSVLIMLNERNKLDTELQEYLKEYEKSLKTKYRVKSQVKQWMYDCLEKEKKKFIKENMYTTYLRSMIEFEKCNLHQQYYFLEREIQFLTQNKQKLIEHYKIDKYPAKEFSFFRMIWFPKNYIINQDKIYNLQKYVEYKNSTYYPFWRWTNFFIRTWVYFSNSFFLFGLVIPFVSPVSYRALFSPKTYYPETTIDHDRGQLIVDKNNKVTTYVSKLVNIWTNVRKSREKFEQTPDKGLIGKTIQRFFNRTWNYVVKGFIGSSLLTLLFPITCLIVSTGSLCIGLLTPIWYPILSLLHHLSFVFIFDWDYWGRFSCVDKFFPIINVLIFRFIICGTVSPILAILTSFVLCPVGSLLITIFAVGRKLFRKTWDSLMFYIILNRNARIPSHDTFVARRIAGPGLASNHFYQIKPEQALSALEIHLEKEILNSYLKFIEEKIQEPLNVYKNFFNPILATYSYSINQDTGPYKKLKKEVEYYLEKYNEEYRKRLSKINKFIDSSQDLSKIRLSEKNLNILIHEATKIVKDNYKKAILNYKKISSKDFFYQKNIDNEDWTTLTGTILERIFGSGILTPLEETHDYFDLQVDHLDLAKYAQMISNSENIRDDLDLVLVNYKPESNHISINMPKLDLVNFQLDSQLNGLYQLSVLGETTELNELNSNIRIPIKMLENPANIPILTYNHGRDNETQINYSTLENLESKMQLLFHTE